MAPYPATTNMGLLLPQQSNATTPEAGPLWATDLNAAFTLVDQHDHSTGKGVQITPTGLNMNANLPFLSGGSYFGPTLQGYSGFYNNPSAAPAGLPNSAFYVKAGDIWYRNASAADIQMTSGSTLNVNVTNAFAGFYGQYANGTTSANAVAYFNNTTKTFEFNKSIPTTPTGYTNNALVYVNTLAITGAGTAGAGFLAPDTTKMTYPSTPRGNWGIVPTNAAGVTFSVAWDSTDNGNTFPGTYTNTAFSITPSTAASLPMQFRAGLSVPNAVGIKGVRAAAQYPLDINWWDATTSTFSHLAAFTAYSSNTPAAGFGPRVNLLAATAAWTGGANGSVMDPGAGTVPASSSQAAIDGFWATVATKSGGVRLRGAYGGTPTATPGLEIANLDGTADYIGLGGAATTGGTVTVYGSMVPNASATLGSTTLPFGNTYTTNIRTGTAAQPLTIYAGSNTLAVPSGNTPLTFTGGLTLNAAGQVDAGNYLPRTAAAYLPGVGGLSKANQVLAFANVPSSGTSPTNGYNVASIAWASNACTVTLSNAVGTSCVAFVTGSSGSSTVVITANAVQTSSTTFVVNTFASTVGAANQPSGSLQAFQILIVGSA